MCASAGHPPRGETIFCDERSTNARAILAALGYGMVPDPAKADLLWLRGGHKEFQNRLRAYQLLNHIPNEGVIVEKGHLAHHLKEFDRTRPRGDLSLGAFYPDTYRLYDDDECRAFFARLPESDDPDNLWIFKPTDSSSGRGMQIVWQFEGLKQMYRDMDRDMFAWAIGGGREYIVQRYLKNPLLLQDRKSEIRVYWLIACLDPLLVLLFKEGTARLNSRPYRLDDFDDVLVHVTNIYQQKHHPDYDPSLTLKWSFSRLQAYLEDELHLAGPDFIDGQLRPQLSRCLEFVTRATAQTLVQTPESGLFFGLYGADFILDDHLHPWLTEVQLGPGLSYDDPIKKQLIPAVLGEAVQIVLEVQERQRRGDPLGRLDCVDGFEWMINEA